MAASAWLTIKGAGDGPGGAVVAAQAVLRLLPNLHGNGGRQRGAAELEHRACAQELGGQLLTAAGDALDCAGLPAGASGPHAHSLEAWAGAPVAEPGASPPLHSTTLCSHAAG
jgi:hypothetical protein